MLLFRFEGHETATRKDLAIAWSPFVLLDWPIVEFLLGLMLWYADKSDRWRYSLVAAGLSALLAITHINCSLDVAGYESQWKLGVKRNGLKLPLQTRVANHESTARRTWTY